MLVDYRAPLPHLFTPAISAQKGSIPGLVELLRVFLARDDGQGERAHVGARHRAAEVRADQSERRVGFELLRSVVLNVPLCV